MWTQAISAGKPEEDFIHTDMMDFKLTTEQEMIREMTRDFTEKTIKPVAARFDEERQFPYENLKKMAELGLMGMNIPVKYGGSEVGSRCQQPCHHRDCKRMCLSCRYNLRNQYGGRGDLPVRTGRDQEATTFPGYVTANIRPAHLPLRNPTPGLMWQIFGHRLSTREGITIFSMEIKSLITSGEAAGVTVVWAVTDHSARKGKGLSAFAVEKGTPGFRVGKAEGKMGHQASQTNELIFDNCIIPAAVSSATREKGSRSP